MSGARISARSSADFINDNDDDDQLVDEVQHAEVAPRFHLGSFCLGHTGEPRRSRRLAASASDHYNEGTGCLWRLLPSTDEAV